MKKVLAIILAAMMALTLMACKKEVNEVTEDNKETEAAEETAEKSAGGWNVYGDNEETEMPEEAKEAFDKAMEGMTGAKYQPIAYLGNQLVAGMNYRYLCTTTLVTQQPVTKLTVVTVYKDLEGNASVTNTVEIDPAAMFDDQQAVEFDPADIVGGWNAAEAQGCGLADNAQEAFDKATEALMGVGYEPLAVLSTQVVAGTNYTILAKATTVTAEPATALAVLKIYQDLQGGAEVLDITAFVVE